MEKMQYYFKMGLNKYSDFKGRSTKEEFWWFTLSYLCLTIILYTAMIASAVMGSSFLSILLGLIVALFSLAIFIPGLSVLVRRLHDTGRSGWFYLISFVPLVGTIVLIVFLTQDSEPHINEWGAEPGSGGGHEDALDYLDGDIV